MNINETPNICVATLNTTFNFNTLSEKIAAGNKLKNKNKKQKQSKQNKNRNG